MKGYLLTAIVLGAAAFGGGWMMLKASKPSADAGGTGGAELALAAADPATDPATRGAQLYQGNCAACHGAKLEGQADWQTPGPDGRLPAPPHDESGHTWHHSDDLLFDYTKLGGQAALAAQGIAFNSGMPAFSDILKDQEIRDILAFIKSTWPERVRELQAARTKAERLQKEANK